MTTPRDAFVILRLGSQPFAVPLASVCDVARAPTIIAVPGMEAALRGMAVLSGHVVPIIDLRAAIGLPLAEHIGTVLVVTHRGERVGVLVDRMEDVLHLPHAETPAGPLSDAAWRHSVAGLVHRPQDIVVVLDLARMIDSLIEGARLEAVA